MSDKITKDMKELEDRIRNIHNNLCEIANIFDVYAFHQEAQDARKFIDNAAVISLNISKIMKIFYVEQEYSKITQVNSNE